MSDITDTEPGQRIWLEHADGSTLANREVDSVYSVLAGKRREYVNDLLDTGWSVTRRESPVVLPTDPGSIVLIKSADLRHHSIAWLDSRGETWDILTPRGASAECIADPIAYLRDQGFRADSATLLIAAAEVAA